jgi:hypothetical protein
VGSVNVHGVEIPETEWLFSSVNTPDEPPSIPEVRVRERLSYCLDPKIHGPEYMTEEMLFIMCPVHVAFVLSTKTWGKSSDDHHALQKEFLTRCFSGGQH